MAQAPSTRLAPAPCATRARPSARRPAAAGDSGECSRPAAARWAASPAIGRSEVLWVVLAGVLLAVITTWPLILHMPSRVAPDLVDPGRTSWAVAWAEHGHA